MPKPFLTENQCSKEFYHSVRNNLNILPISIHGSKIEEVEGADVIYILRNFRDKDVKALLVQEKAPYSPAYTFQLKRVNMTYSTIGNRLLGVEPIFMAYSAFKI